MAIERFTSGVGVALPAGLAAGVLNGHGIAGATPWQSASPFTQRGNESDDALWSVLALAAFERVPALFAFNFLEVVGEVRGPCIEGVYGNTDSKIQLFGVGKAGCGIEDFRHHADGQQKADQRQVFFPQAQDEQVNRAEEKRDDVRVDLDPLPERQFQPCGLERWGVRPAMLVKKCETLLPFLAVAVAALYLICRVHVGFP